MDELCDSCNNNYLLVGQDFRPIFVEKPNSNITEEINTTISLLWRIQYEPCNKCLQVLLNTSNNHGLYDYRYPEERYHDILDNFLFDAKTTLMSAGPNGTSNSANVHIIMYINEFVRNNVPFIYCKVVVSREQTFINSSTVHIVVTDQPRSLPPTAVPSLSSTLTLCNSAHMVCSSEPCLGLLCFIQLLYFVIASYCS